MALFHYIKRELETLFVHKFSSDTMPLFNIFKNSFHYFGLFGFLTMYFYIHPNYTPPAWGTPTIFYILLGFFLLFELLNLKCHMILSNLRPPGTTKRGIPKGWGFGFVSSANYWWEACAWTTFCVMAQTFGGYIFLVASFAQMLIWALKKHKRYRTEFADYPRGRKAMVPFII
jgi:very-long-chain enoyl-CoA reductase